MTATNPLGQLLTVTEVAERLHLSPRTVRRRIASGEMPAVRLGSGPQAPVRVDPHELDAYVFGVSPILDGRGEPSSVPPEESS